MEQEPRIVTTEEFNSKVAAFGSSMGQKIRDQISLMSNDGKGDLLKSFRMKTRKYYGEIDKITYTFAQHGVFWHKGVGRGYAMVGGKVMRVSGSLGNTFAKEYAKAKNRTFTPKVLSDLSFNRQPEEWFNPVLDANLDALGDLVAEMGADRLVRVSGQLTEKNVIAIK